MSRRRPRLGCPTCPTILSIFSRRHR
jgi:hypothetical protein